MNKTTKTPSPFKALEIILSADDDPSLWRAALSVVTDDFLQKYSPRSASKNWGMVVGACSHWLRPHQTRWTAAGGFASPDGYRSLAPEFDWSVALLFRQGVWVPVARLPRRRLRFLRVVIPSRTARRRQAAIYSRWQPGEGSVCYGFRKFGGEWRCVAASDEDRRGRVLAKP